MKTVAFITIKLNSQRLPHKNILPLMEHPLCWHIADTMTKVCGVDDVYVYCSDETVVQYLPSNVKFLKRDKYLDGDKIRAKDTYTAFINDVDADVYIAACTTSPFTKVSSVENALENVHSGEYDSAFSAKRIQTFCWYKGKPINYKLDSVPRTQDMDPVFEETSAFFIFKKKLWTEYGQRIGFKPYIQEVDDIEGIDIDTKEDYDFATIVVKALSDGGKG